MSDTREAKVKYAVPILLDDHDKPIGYFTLHTSLGSYLMVFTDQSHLGFFKEYAAKLADRDGPRAGIVHMEGSSAEDIHRQLLKLDPTLKGKFRVVGEDDTDYHHLFNGILSSA